MNLRNLFQNTPHGQKFQAGTTIFDEGAPGDFMYVVLDGELEVWTGNELKDVLGPGQIVGEMALIDSEPRSATVVAKSNCHLALIDEKRFLFMVDETPNFALHVMRILVKRLRLKNEELKAGSSVV